MRKFGPRPSDDDEGDSIRQPCAACQRRFLKGDYTTLVALGPGDDEEEQQRARLGGPYNAIAVEVHWACATGKEEE